MGSWSLHPAHHLTNRYIHMYVKIGSCSRWSIQLWKVSPICFWGFSGCWIWWWCCCSTKLVIRLAGMLLSVTTIPRSYVSCSLFRICPSFSSVTSSTFYDLLSLTHAYDFHMLTISHAYDFTCLRLSHVNHIHMFLLYLFVRLPCTI